MPSLILAHQFTVQPESVVQAEELEAVFECQCPGAIAHSWRINGEFLREDQFLPGVTRISPSVDSPTARLIIPATPQYNNTVVQCRVFLSSGDIISSSSSSVLLQVQGQEVIYHVYIKCISDPICIRCIEGSKRA